MASGVSGPWNLARDHAAQAVGQFPNGPQQALGQVAAELAKDSIRLGQTPADDPAYRAVSGARAAAAGLSPRLAAQCATASLEVLGQGAVTTPERFLAYVALNAMGKETRPEAQVELGTTLLEQADPGAHQSLQGMLAGTSDPAEKADWTKAAIAVFLECPAPASEPAPPSHPDGFQVGLGLPDAKSLDDIQSMAPQLGAVARAMATQDIHLVLGPTAQDMADHYLLEDSPAVRDAHQTSKVLLEELADKVLSHVDDGKFVRLDHKRMSEQMLGDAVGQHVGYTTGVLTRQHGKEGNTMIARAVLSNYFQRVLEHRDQPERQIQDRRVLADDLARAWGNKAVADSVMDPQNDGMFAPAAVLEPKFLNANLAAVYAGEATVQFAARLMGNSDRAGEALVKHVFARPDKELARLMKDPHGREGALVHFAAMANHLAWSWATMSRATVEAGEGKESAVERWNNPRIRATSGLVAADADAASKLTDQVESYLLRRGSLVPCERSGPTGEISRMQLFRSIAAQGIYQSGDDHLRILSPFAEMYQSILHGDVKEAALVELKPGCEALGNSVAHLCAAFASHATKANWQEREELVHLYSDAINRFTPQIGRLTQNGEIKPDAKDSSYQALYQDLAGEFGFAALKDNLGVGRAHDMVRNAGVSHLVDMACDSLRLEKRPDFTPQQIAQDIADLKQGLLKDDYFLSQDGYVEALQAEAAEPPRDVNRKDLENGIRVPNAIWMWLQLVRGVVENKPGRYTGGEADMESDNFPSQVQLNPPDVRDVELFTWARHRLSEHGMPAREATRKALAVVVLTLKKDLDQLRDAA